MSFEICPQCGIQRKKPVSSLCVPCSNERIKIKSKEYAAKYRKEKIIKEKKLFHCKSCLKTFQKKSNGQLYCNDPCLAPKEKSISRDNKKWLEKVEVEKKRADNEKVAYSFFRKKYSVPNNVFRG